jgi:hypothetical protein
LIERVGGTFVSAVSNLHLGVNDSGSYAALGMFERWKGWFEENPWKPVSAPAVIGWSVFYVLFLVYAASMHGQFLFIDFVNLVIHEGGHPLFGYLGEVPGVWGGTILQWLVPFALATYFFFQRQTTAFVFSLFFFFENWLYTATYMADARAQVLPLVAIGGGDGDENMHDWYNIFSRLGVLDRDTYIAQWVRTLGWFGMIVCVLFLLWRYRQDRATESAA